MANSKCINIDELYFDASHNKANNAKHWRHHQKNTLFCKTGHLLANGLSGYFGLLLTKRLSLLLDDYSPKVDRNHIFLMGFKSPINESENTQKLYIENIERFKKTLEHIRGIASPHITFFSAISVYGDDWDGRDLMAKPLKGDYYSAAKLAAENILITHCSNYSGNFTILRVPGLIGPHCRRNFICNAFHQISNNKTIFLRSPENLFNNIFSVENLFRLLMDITTRSQKWEDQTINLGATAPLSIQECLDILGTILHQPVQTTIIGEVKERVISTDPLVQLGFSPDSVDVMLRQSFS